MREYEPTTEDMREHYTELVEKAGEDGWWAGKRWDEWIEYTYGEPEKLLNAALAEVDRLTDNAYDFKQVIADLEAEISGLEAENERLVNELADAKTP